MLKNTTSKTGESSEPKRPAGAFHLLSLAPGIFAGILIGLLAVVPRGGRIENFANADAAGHPSNIDLLSQDEIRALIIRALSRLGEQQGLGVIESGDEDSRERAVYTRKDVERGVRNLRRLLPAVKGLSIDTLHQATAGYIKPVEWPKVTRLMRGVCRIVRSETLRGMAGVRDGRPWEILVDPEYAPYLISDDEAVFVLAHELTHVAARSGKLNRFIDSVAENAKHSAHVEPTEDQKEDLACDFVGELVLKRFIALNPTGESTALRLSKVFGYESPSERFKRAWEDFCASYNGDPGDDDHLNQYQTIRALLALDPELPSLMPLPGDVRQAPACPDLPAN